jgi:DNA excision repair protein ERCC-2
MAVQALTAMNDAGSFRTLQVRAKEKMCANTQIICHEDFCPYAKNFPQKMERSKILDRLRESQRHHDPDEVFAAAKREEVCPFEVQLELAAKADAVVADYNYVFEPGTALRHLEDLSGAILLVDEAHNLPDRARQIFSPELREATVRAAQAFCGGGWKNIAGQSEKSSKRRKQPRAEQNELTLDGGGNGDCFEHVGEELKTLLDTLEVTAQSLPAGATIGETKPPARALLELWKNWETAFISYLLWKRARKIVLPDDPIVEVHFALQRFMAMWKEFFDAEQSNGFTCVVERAEKGIRLALLCLDPARALGKVFRASHAAIFLSATLRPTEKIQRTLGLEPKRTASVSLPPAFPRENRKILVLPQVRTTFAARDRNYPRIATLIREMADAVPGNVLALFPSYAFLAKVAELLPPVRAEIIAQRADFSDAERQKIFARLASPPPRGLLLLAVMGGMYAEGVDYPGELLLGVFVVSPALPQVSFERELLRRHFDEQEQAGFEYAYLQPGMTRVIQAAGRLIRSETDRGVIALICQRFLQEPYASYLPRDWYDESPTELTSQNPAEEIREFFAAPGRMEDLRR